MVDFAGEDDPSSCPVCGAKGYSCSPAMLGSGVKIVRLDAGEKEAPVHTLAKRTYVNRDSTKIVEEGSADAAYLLGNEGDEISVETAERLGLVSAAGEDYSAMKVAELRKLAKDRDVDVDSDATKAELVEALTGADATAATGGTAEVETPAEA